MKLFIEISTGILLKEEPSTTAARIFDISDCSDEEDSHLIKYYKLIDKLMPPVHYVLVSEECENLEFLDYIREYFSVNHKTTRYMNSTVTHITDGEENYVLTDDSGFVEFRFSNFVFIHELFLKSGI